MQPAGTLRNHQDISAVATTGNTHEDATSPVQPPSPPYACPYYAAQETQVDDNICYISEGNPPAYHAVIPSNSEPVTQAMVNQSTPPTDTAFPLPITTNTVPTLAIPQQSDCA